MAKRNTGKPASPAACGGVAVEILHHAIWRAPPAIDLANGVPVHGPVAAGAYQSCLIAPTLGAAPLLPIRPKNKVKGDGSLTEAYLSRPLPKRPDTRQRSDTLMSWRCKAHC